MLQHGVVNTPFLCINGFKMEKKNRIIREKYIILSKMALSEKIIEVCSPIYSTYTCMLHVCLVVQCIAVIFNKH